MMESDWLDRLEKKLKRSPESAADAEEISENLDVSFQCFIYSLYKFCVYYILIVCVLILGPGKLFKASSTRKSAQNTKYRPVFN